MGIDTLSFCAMSVSFALATAVVCTPSISAPAGPHIIRQPWIKRQPYTSRAMPLTMLLGPGNSDPKFDSNDVAPDAARRTLTGQAAVSAILVGSILLIKSSGKEFGLDNAPGRAELAAKN